MLFPLGQGTRRAARTVRLDLREFESRHHISVVFERLDDLGPDDHLFVISGSDPQPMRRKVEAWCPGEYAWASVGAGPPVWAAEVTRCRRGYVGSGMYALRAVPPPAGDSS